MSTNYFAACLNCNVYVDLGIRYAGGWTFGISSKDREGHVEAGQFIQTHAGHDYLVTVDEHRMYGEKPWSDMREIEWDDCEEHDDRDMCFRCGLPHPEAVPDPTEACWCEIQDPRS